MFNKYRCQLNKIKIENKQEQWPDLMGKEINNIYGSNIGKIVKYLSRYKIQSILIIKQNLTKRKGIPSVILSILHSQI